MHTWCHCGLVLSLLMLVACDNGDGNEHSDQADAHSTSEISPSSSDSQDTPLPVGLCSVDSECDDGIECTRDACVSQVCRYDIATGYCLIDNVCRQTGATQHEGACALCDPQQTARAWSAASDGQSCVPSDLCQREGQCKAGLCVSEQARDCDDQNPCTQDSCDPARGCVSTLLEPDDTPCDDGDACTENTSCQEGVCIGTAIDCDDHNPCTSDTCEASLGCRTEPIDGGCDDDDPCTISDQCIDGNCVGGTPNPCDDDNGCTIDLCDTHIGCAHLPTESPCCIGLNSVCDDSEPCTEDHCDPVTAGCSYTLLDATTCDDGDLCTELGTCVDGSCESPAKDCDDANPCTLDTCGASTGCAYTPTEGVCDDGLACSTGDHCEQGMCVADTSGCDNCSPEFSTYVSKMTSIELGEGGHPGEGLDLDQDPTTCSPSNDCSSGVHNTLGILSAVVGDAFQASLDDGTLVLIAEFDAITNGAHEMTLFRAVLDPSNASCQTQSSSCTYLVDSSFLDPENCTPLATLPVAIEGQSVEGGSLDSSVPFQIPLGTSILEVTLHSVQFSGSLDLDNGSLQGVSGVLGGAIPKDKLLEAIASVPPESFPEGLSSDTVAVFLDLIENDIDTTGDGIANAVSVGLKVSGIGGSISGVLP